MKEILLFSKGSTVNPIALRMAKTQLSFGHFECNRVKGKNFFPYETGSFLKRRVCFVFFSPRKANGKLSVLSLFESKWWNKYVLTVCLSYGV